MGFNQNLAFKENNMNFFNDSAYINRYLGFNELFSDDNLLSKESNFPPYDIIKKDDTTTELRFALAGYSKDDLEITINGNVLKICSVHNDEHDDAHYLKKGIAKREFSHMFKLAPNTDVSSSMKDGMLSITVVAEKIGSDIKKIDIK